MWLALLLLPATSEEMALPPKVQGGVTAVLSVRVADQTPQPGTARVRLRLTAEGPADLAVEGPELEDALSGWRVTLRTSSIRPDNGEWECALDLVQVKPGVVPLPGVSIRVKTGGSWEKFAWPDLLHEPADVAPVVEVAPPPPSAWRGHLCWTSFIVLALLGLAVVVFAVRRWATRPAPAMPPLEAALAAIDRVRGSLGDPLHLVAELDGVLRAYLETLGIPATRLTGVELRGRLLGGGGELAAILTRGEAMKFAGSQVGREEVRELADEARRVLVASLERRGGQG